MERIHRLTMPYKDIFTTVYAVMTDEGALLFDTGSYDEDVEQYILPFLKELGITADMLKYIFVSHNHKDHAGGLNELMKYFPDACIVSRCPKLQEHYKDCKFLAPDDGHVILGALQTVTVPGHTADSSAVFDKRSNTLISGDCLQLYGIYGSGNWGSNISLPREHIEAVAKLRRMDIQCILTAHDYHPYGYCYRGKEEVSKALDACIEPLDEIRAMILKKTDMSDEEICNKYNSLGNPTLGTHVVTALRGMI